MNEIDRFGKVIVESIRDNAIEQTLRVLSGQHPSQLYNDLSNVLVQIDEAGQNAIRQLVLHSVDYSMLNMMLLIEETAEGVGDVAGLLEKEGFRETVGQSDALVGEFVGEGGWVNAFSRYDPSVLTP